MNLHGILNEGQGRWLRVRRGTAMALAIGVAMLGGIAVATNAQAAPRTDKAWVCKYVGTPYVNETIKKGNYGLVWVDSSATQGTWFNDRHGSSFVLLYGPHAPKPDASQCPAGRMPVVTVVSRHETTCTVYRVRDVTTTIGWVKVDGQWVQGEPVITYGDWVNSVPTPDQLAAAQLDCTDRLIEVLPEATATQGTCDAAGQVTLVTKTGYSWGPNTGTENDPRYEATAAAGYVLTRSGEFTFHGLNKLPSNSAACSVVPPPPPPPPPAIVPPPRAIVPPPPAAAPTVLGVVMDAPVVAGVVKDAPAVKTLAFTGAETVPLSLSGLLALLLGAALTVASRRQGGKEARE